MNSKKLILASILCLVLILGLYLSDTGRFSGLRNDDLWGTWSTTVPASNYVREIVSSGLGVDCEVNEDLQITYIFEYRQDGSLTLCLDNASAEAVVEALKLACESALPEAIYANFLNTQGLSREETDAFLLTLGTDIHALVADSMGSINFDGILQQELTPMVMYYQFKDNKIYYASAPETLEAGKFEHRVDPALEGNKLTLGNATDAEGNPFEGSNVFKYPLILTRK